MSTLFEKRERAAESLFAHSEETRFLVRRRAVEALAAWAGESMGLDAVGQAAYAQSLVDRFVAGTQEDQLVLAVQSDLERAGKPALVGHVGAQFALVTAEAIGAANGALEMPGAPKPHDFHEEFERRHPKSHAWSL